MQYTVNLDEMLQWIDEKTVVYASETAAGPHIRKSLYIRLKGGYAVERDGMTIYEGTDGQSAVNAYNEI